MLPFFDKQGVALRAGVRSWAEKHLFVDPPTEDAMEREAVRLVEALGRAGFLAPAVAKEYGGFRAAAQARDLCVIREELARGAALADTMFAIQALGSYPITLFGTAQQKRRYLPPLAAGSTIAAFALTEPNAGSDPAAIESRAVRRGKQYALDGTKRFISNAGIADHYIVFVSTDREKKGKGLTAFVVDADSAGLIVKEKTPLLSPHPIGVIAFENCLVPESARLGLEGDGLKIALRTLDTLRCTVGAAAVGLAQRALEEAIRYSKQRRQFGRPLAEFQAIQFKIAEMATELETARLLVYHAAWLHDQGAEEAKQKSSMAKFHATEAAQRIIDQALQIHGGAGLIAGSIMERLYRDVRALRIYEGTSEIQKLVIAREMLKKATGNRH